MSEAQTQPQRVYKNNYLKKISENPKQEKAHTQNSTFKLNPRREVSDYPSFIHREGFRQIHVQNLSLLH